MITRIDTHVQDAIARLIEQYKTSVSIKDVLTALIDQHQHIEDDVYPFKDRLDVNISEGKQLDKFGVIVVQRRQGLDDPLYRLILIAKIGVNISNGEPERVISVFKIMTQGNFVHYMNHNFGEIALATDGSIADEFINIVFEQIERTLAAGVRIADMVFHDDVPFAFAGTNTAQTTDGFGTVANGATGGQFAWLRRFTPSFAFDGDDLSTRGFGSIEDPIVGGGLGSL